MALEKKYTEHKKLVVGENDLLTWCNEHGEEGQTIIKEWNQSRNGSMTNYKAGSDKRVYWNCSICKQPYIKEVRSRVAGRLHEPCGRKIGIENLRQYHKEHMTFNRSLAGVHPELLQEWDYEKNMKLGFSPEYLSARSSKKVYWICKKCGHKWKGIIRTRTNNGCGCKACRIRKFQSKSVSNNIE